MTANGTVVVVRAVGTTGSNGVSPVRVQLLRTIGADTAAAKPLIEVLVREDSGRMVALIQPPTPRELRPGERVIVNSSGAALPPPGS